MPRRLWRLATEAALFIINPEDEAHCRCREDDDFFRAQALIRETHVSRVICLVGLPDLVRNENGFRLAKTLHAMDGRVALDSVPSPSTKRYSRS